jgi:hypothetical protein
LNNHHITLDRQGKTCLHLAVMLVGKDHELAVAREEEILRFEKNTESDRRKQDQETNDTYYDESKESEDSDGDQDIVNPSLVDETAEVGSKSRKLIQYLISVYPQALCIQNNFHATPVETVVEKARKTQSKFKKVLVWGLFDDPITARILLLAHKRSEIIKNIYNESQTYISLQNTNFYCNIIIFNPCYRYSNKRILPSMRLSHLRILYDLNWQCRRLALQASYNDTVLPLYISSLKAGLHDIQLKEKADERSKGKNAKGKQKKHQQSTGLQNKSPLNASASNILAKLRQHGHEDCIKLCISWI